MAMVIVKIFGSESMAMVTLISDNDCVNHFFCLLPVQSVSATHKTAERSQDLTSKRAKRKCLRWLLSSFVNTTHPSSPNPVASNSC